MCFAIHTPIYDKFTWGIICYRRSEALHLITAVWRTSINHWYSYWRMWKQIRAYYVLYELNILFIYGVCVCIYSFLMKHFIIWCKLSNGRTWNVWWVYTIRILWVNAINMIIPYRTHTSKIKMTSESYMFDLHLPVKIVWWWMKISSKRLTEAWCPQCEKIDETLCDSSRFTDMF